MYKSLLFSLLLLISVSSSIKFLSKSSIFTLSNSSTKISASTLKDSFALQNFYIIDTREVPIIAQGYISNSLIIPSSMFSWLPLIVPESGHIIIITDNNNYISTLKKYNSLKNYKIYGYCFYDEVIKEVNFDIQRIEYDQNTYESIQNIIKNKGTIIDIREIKEYKETGVIKEAKLIPMSTFMKKNYLQIPKKGNVYVYCYGGTRAVVAMSFIKRAGYTNKFFIMKKGLYQAIQEKYPLIPYTE